MCLLLFVVCLIVIPCQLVFKGFADSCTIANDFVWTRLHGALCVFGDIKNKTIENVS